MGWIWVGGGFCEKNKLACFLLVMELVTAGGLLLSVAPATSLFLGCWLAWQASAAGARSCARPRSHRFQVGLFTISGIFGIVRYQAPPVAPVLLELHLA